MNVIVAPSVLSMDYSRVGESMEELNASRALAVHFDVMDGHFVPNLTFGPDILKGLRKLTDKEMDVHLMVTDPAMFAMPFIQAGADQITFHQEAVRSPEGLVLVEKIHGCGKKAGISVRPKTQIETVLPYLEGIDTVLVMTVEPGFGGQKFMEDMMDKVRWLAIYRDSHDLRYRIEVDGGVNQQTAQIAKEAGADMLVAGSYVFHHPEGIAKAVETLL